MPDKSGLRRLRKFVADDSMTIALFSLFLVCVVAQSFAGWFAYSTSLQAAHLHQVTFDAYLGTGNFLDGAFSNWEAAILQLAVLVAFSSVLRQKGAAHSRKEHHPNHRTLDWKFGPRSTLQSWLYGNSLSLIFFALFVAMFVLHLWFGERKYNEDQALQHLSAMSLGAYAVSASFWFSVFQCWEAEFAAIAIYIIFSIFLRQEGSSESKPVGSGDEQTGEVNE